MNLLIGAFEPRRAFFLVTVLKHSPSAIPLSKSTLPCFYDRTRALMKCVRILYSAAVLRRFPFGSCGAPSAAVCALADRRERPEARMPSRGGCVPPGEVPLGLHRFRVLNEGILSRNKAIISFYSHETVIVCVFVRVYCLAGNTKNDLFQRKSHW